MMWHSDIPLEYRNQIVTGDAKELSKRIPDESIDLIFTDPVYDRIEDYEWLAFLSEKILVEGGSLITQTNANHRFDAETIMRKSNLTPRPLLSEIMMHGLLPMAQHHSLQGWKPYIWMSKGRRKGRWIVDRVLCGRSDKRFHRWGDGAEFFSIYIERIANISEVVFDPFTGSGTVPAVCKILSRDYIAFEIDPDTAELARERVLNTQPPLFVLEPEQLALLEEA